MAFVNRARRETSKIMSPTPQDIGPGYYNPFSPNNRERVSYAPFASSAERGVDLDPVEHTPGPGEYGASTVLTSPKFTATSSAFVSRVGRFGQDNAKVEDTPGPGAYSQKVAWGQQRRRHRRKQGAHGQIQWVRVAAAPSIPAPAQSYGYEENETGDLILQNAPTKGYSGLAGDSVGPTGYDVPRFLTTGGEAKGGDFSRSHVHRTMNKPLAAKDVLPGPGNYATVEPKNLGFLQSNRKSAAFVSRTKRWDVDKEMEAGKTSPGPGTYEAFSATGFVSASVPEEYQFFGSRVGRQGALVFAEETPGPGAYTANKFYHPSGLDDEAVNKSDKSAFSTTTSRFTKVASATVPGPGAYVAMANTSQELSKKIFGRNTSFLSTTKRFEKKKVEEVPGPGAYVERKLVRAVRENAAYASENDRFPPKLVTNTPAPGAYNNDVHNTIAAKVGAASMPGYGPAASPRSGVPVLAAIASPTSSFANKGSRFVKALGAVANTPAHLGPGAYDAGETLTKPSTTKVASTFQSGNQRFKNSKADRKAPGPGTYFDENSSSLVKRSFNITVGDTGSATAL